MRFTFILLLTALIFAGSSALPAGELLEISSKLGEDIVYQPRQILVSDTDILVLDEADYHIKIFDRKTNTFKMKIGGQGEGPGQFQQVRSFDLYDGKIVALDVRKLKVHYFSLADKTYLTSARYVSLQRGYQPYEFIIANNGLIYYSVGSLLAGNHLIVKMNANLEAEGGFLDSFPAYKNNNDYDLNYKSQRQVINRGYIAATGGKIYYTYWMHNKVLEFSLEGKQLNEYVLPIASIDETYKVIKYKSTDMLTIDSRLNYDLIGRNGSVYILSRHPEGFSIIFRLLNGKVTEMCRLKRKLYGIEITDQTIYAADQEEGEVVIYNR